MNHDRQLTVSALNVYPVKSMAGWTLPEAEVVDTGFRHDREWMLVDERNNFVSQRQHPKMARIQPSLHGDQLILTVAGRPPVSVPIQTAGRPIATEVWTSECRAIDQGDEVAAWLGDYLGKPCRLVRMDPGFKRMLKDKYLVAGDEVVGFADRLPFLLTTEASLADLNTRLHQPVPMSRFRPNIVITGASAYEEDSWKKIKIGAVVFRLEKPCDRCEIITVDQQTGEKGTEPLETLGTYRAQPKGIMFGQIMVHESRGAVRVGDTVEVLA